MLSYPISASNHCRQLESFLRTLMPTAPAGYPRKLIKSGAARLNGSAAAPDSLLSIHDTVTLKESSAARALLAGTPPTLDILYEDSRIAVINKPSGLPMHRSAELEENLVEFGQSWMEWRGTPCKLYPVNRLDRGTSGAVILAKSSNSAGAYGRQVKETGLDKLYLALVSGIPDSTGVIIEPLDDKESETRYRILFTGDNCSLLAVTPISGRMHQIRRHLSATGHPVLGDKRYGGGETDEFSGFALHSFRTQLVRAEGGTLTVCAPVSAEILARCEQNGIATDPILEAVYRLA
jgi:23S rRNA pseudouridine955/2504/2580 synthase